MARPLRRGDVLEGTVTHITGFGLFVDIGVADRLVHRSEITWDKAVNPTTVHAVGNRVRVLVTVVDPDLNWIFRCVPPDASGGPLTAGREYYRNKMAPRSVVVV